MRISEIFNFRESKNHPEYIKRVSNLGVLNFGKNKIVDKDVDKTPHYEAEQCLQMYEDNPIVAPAVNQLIEFIIPDKEVQITSPDPKSKKFVEDWYNLRDDSLEEIKNILKTNIVTGNAYMEQRFIPHNNNNVLDNFFSINDVTRVFVNPDDIDGETAYIFQLPVGMRQFWYMGELQQPNFYKVTYIKNYQFTFKMVWGFPIPGWKIKHYKSGWSRDNIYGRSQLASGIAANAIFNQILSSWDTISKTRMMGQKLISVADGETGMNIDQERLDEMAEELEDTSSSYKLFNVPLKFLQTDISSGGSYDLMENPLDMLRRMVMMSLLPQHLTPWSDSATTMGADSAMPPFLGRIKAKQNEYINFLNNAVIDELRKTYTWIHPDTSHVFQEPKILGDDQYVRFITDLLRDDIITKEQARKYLLGKGILDEELLNDEGSDKKNDFLKDPLSDDTGELEPSSSFHEGVIPQITSFATFKKNLKDKKGIELKNARELKNYNVGGQVIRLIEDPDNYSIYNGLNNIENLNRAVVNEQTAKQALDNYRKKLIEAQEEFEKGDSDEDKIIDELEKDIKNILQKQLISVFKKIDDNKLKKEGFKEDFVNPKILPSLDDAFNVFGKKINDIVRRAMDKLGVVVISDDNDNVKPDLETKNLLVKRNTLFKKNLIDQIKTTKDKSLVDIKTRISNGIASGQPVSKIKSDVEKDFNYENGVGWKFDRIIRTGTRQSAGLLKLKKYQKMGFDEFQWRTVGDEKVREDHRKRNKRVYKIQDALDGKMPYPGGSVDMKAHPNYNCRCRILPYD